MTVAFRRDLITTCATVAAVVFLFPGCNNPYPEEEEGKNIVYSSFHEEPKHLDPARSYSTDESAFMTMTLQPVFQYHFLKRPYELVPLTAVAIPKAETRTVTYQGKDIEAVVYRIELQKGILYQDHPAFVEANRRLTDKDMKEVTQLWDIEQRATRELVASDYINGICRLADPRNSCPIFTAMSHNLLGLTEYQEMLRETLDGERAKRKKASGPLYNLELDEKSNPIHIDYLKNIDEFPFARAIGPHTFEVVLKHPYPQILYWLAMDFFAPIPPEVVEFFDQGPLIRKGIILDKNPMGTGPYVLKHFDPTSKIVFVRNKNFRGERYPDLPEPTTDDPIAVESYKAMKEAGVLEDTGKLMPMVDKVVFSIEKEQIPRWNKFLQGYYDYTTDLHDDTFDQAVSMSSTGDSVLTDDMAKRGIKLLTSYPTKMWYYGFNMADPVVGGYSEKQKKLRRAIGIAFGVEDWISIFLNDRGIPAHSPIPPGIFGHDLGKSGINPHIYSWDERRKKAVRRSLEEAKKLLAEAGYPNGYGPDGQPLKIRFTTTFSRPEDRAKVDFIIKQFAKINIKLIPEISDYNRFRDKVYSGNYQFLRWGWVADYPDPENFLFLLYGPNAKIKTDGENVSNYENAEYDMLFRQMRSMENTPERLEIIRKMREILWEDSPWIMSEFPIIFGLYHSWYENAYPHALAYNIMKYKYLDVEARGKYRKKFNKPRLWPVFLFLALIVIGCIPAVKAGVKHFKEA